MSFFALSSGEKLYYEDSCGGSQQNSSFRLMIKPGYRLCGFPAFTIISSHGREQAEGSRSHLYPPAAAGTPPFAAGLSPSLPAFRYCVGENPVDRLKEEEKCSMEEKPVRSPISVTVSLVFSRNWAAAAILASFSF